MLIQSIFNMVTQPVSVCWYSLYQYDDTGYYHHTDTACITILIQFIIWYSIYQYGDTDCICMAQPVTTACITMLIQSISIWWYRLYQYTVLYKFCISHYTLRYITVYVLCILLQIAIHGKNFCASAKDAFFLLLRNIVR